MTKTAYPNDKAWEAMGRALSLSPWQRADIPLIYSFAELEQMFLRPATTPVNVDDWHSGLWNGHRCAVGYLERGDSRRRSYHTELYIELRRPMLIGLEIDGQFLGAFGGLLRSSREVTLGIPVVDERLRIESNDAERARALLLQDASDAAFLHRVCELTRTQTLLVEDSFVRIRLSKLVTSAEKIAQGLEEGRRIAEELCRRRDQIGTTRAEAAVRAEWRGVAEASGASFDPQQMRLTTRLPSGEAAVSLDVLPGRGRTLVSVRFANPLPIPLYVRRVLTSFSALFEQDVAVGDPVFDQCYVVQSEQPGWVRELLSPHARRAAMVRIAAASEWALLSERGMYWTTARPALTGSELSAHLAQAAELAAAFAG